MAGWLLTEFVVSTAFLILAGASLLGLVLTWFMWPTEERASLVHSHEGMDHDHDHLKEFGQNPQHSHPYVIDALHAKWPR